MTRLSMNYDKMIVRFITTKCHFNYYTKSYHLTFSYLLFSTHYIYNILFSTFNYIDIVGGEFGFYYCLCYYLLYGFFKFLKINTFSVNFNYENISNCLNLILIFLKVFLKY